MESARYGECEGGVSVEESGERVCKSVQPG